MDKENFYDEHIAPKLLELARQCKDNGLSMVALCEWAPSEFGETTTLRDDAGKELRMAFGIARFGGPILGFMIAAEPDGAAGAVH